MELISIEDNVIEVVPGQINFKKAKDILKSAQKLNDELKNVVVTEETLKEAKKLIAAVRKETDKLDKQRIKVKNEMLKPYDTLQQQIKEIVDTVKEGENIIREQTRAFEEKEREFKRQQLQIIFDKRLKKYPLLNQMKIVFSDFIQPYHLNKTASLEKTEIAMAEWFENINRDIEVMQSMQHSAELIVEYMNVRQLSKAIEIVNARHNTIIEKEQQLSNKDVVKKEYILTVYKVKDKQAILKFAKQNNIEIKENK